jgi:predicted O-methyltransferase YrrM
MSILNALRTLKRRVKKFLPEAGLPLAWVKRDPDSWLCAEMNFDAAKFPETDEFRRFERIAAAINAGGARPLWEGYKAVYQKDNAVPLATSAMERLPDQVRTQPQMGRLFSWLAERCQPDVIVEIGTAFGVSAMYWASGLTRAGKGRLLTFDPNPIWQKIAADHLKGFGDTVEAVFGTFEENIDDRLGDQKVSIAFVDAIHTGEFVDAQVAMLRPRLQRRGIVVLDDITFSDDMRNCWSRWSRDAGVLASVAVDNRVGILEFS